MEPTVRITRERLTSLCPLRSEEGHKGTFGRLLLYAGTEGMGGAAYMAASSALRSGVGLVYLLVPKELIAPLMTMCPEALTIPIPKKTADGAVLQPLVAVAPREEPAWLPEALQGKDAVLLGPGIAPERRDVRENLPVMLRMVPHLVLDAGAISILASEPSLWEEIRTRRQRGLGPVILTPHIGEFLRIFPEWTRGDMEAASAWAREQETILVLKSHQTNIFTPDGKWYSNQESNSGLAKGGSGDVLAGLLAGFLAQGMSEEDASVCAVGIHSLAGRLCVEEHGRRAMLPTMLWHYYDRCFKILNWEEGMENDG